MDKMNPRVIQPTPEDYELKAPFPDIQLPLSGAQVNGLLQALDVATKAGGLQIAGVTVPITGAIQQEIAKIRSALRQPPAGPHPNDAANPDSKEPSIVLPAPAPPRVRKERSA
jgi:hypothetical protein